MDLHHGRNMHSDTYLYAEFLDNVFFEEEKEAEVKADGQRRANCRCVCDMLW